MLKIHGETHLQKSYFVARNLGKPKFKDTVDVYCFDVLREQIDSFININPLYYPWLSCQHFQCLVKLRTEYVMGRSICPDVFTGQAALLPNNRRLEVGGFADCGLKVQQYREVSRPFYEVRRQTHPRASVQNGAKDT
jgi:hypothetical protein